MKYEIIYCAIAEFPKLGWVASLDFATCKLIVFHGSAVECWGSWMVEGVWDGDFGCGDFHRSENFFGSGIKIEDESIYFVPSSALVDRLLYCVDGRKMFVSNSLILLLAFTGAHLDEEHDYRKEANAVLKGVKRYDRGFRILHPRIPRFFQIYHENIVVKDDDVSFQTRSRVQDIQSFEEYCTVMKETLHRLKANYESRARRMSFDAFTTSSSGYDSTAASCLVKSIGVTQCFTRKMSNSAIPGWIWKSMTVDDGAPIAQTLGMQALYLDGAASISDDELYFYATGPAGAYIVFYSMAAHIENNCSAAVVFTGFHGDTVWDVGSESKHVANDITLGGNSGLLFSEIRLKSGFIHVPVPAILAGSATSIVKISQSTEMEPWRLRNSYDRPIPRRIGENAGLDRLLFGVRKKAVLTERPTVPRNKRLRKHFLQFVNNRCQINPAVLYIYMTLDELAYYFFRICAYIRHFAASKLRSFDPLFSTKLRTRTNVFLKDIKLPHLLFFWSVSVLTKRASEILNRSLGKEWPSRFFDVSPRAPGEPLMEGQREKHLST